ncbi:Ig-like domain-containing protein [Flavobacteriaceae bacterium]|nr:Ig-like domain-containing protein [Flavobacteriaceae bacterium]
MPSKYFNRFIFKPEEIVVKDRGKPWSRGFPQTAWQQQYGQVGSTSISLYGKATRFIPEFWEIGYLNWPYGPRKNSSFLQMGKFPFSKTIQHTLPGAYWSSIWQFDYSTHGISNRRYGDALGSIGYYSSNGSPGGGTSRRDPQVEYYIPNEFWGDHDYFRIETTMPLVPDLWNDNSPQDYVKVNYFPGGKRTWNYLTVSLSTYIWPYEIRNSIGQVIRKQTVNNDSPIPYSFGIQGSYKNSESFFSSFAQDKEGDFLIYRWEPIGDIYNGVYDRARATPGQNKGRDFKTPDDYATEGDLSVLDNCDKRFIDCSDDTAPIGVRGRSYDQTYRLADTGPWIEEKERLLHYTYGYSAENPIKFIDTEPKVSPTSETVSSTYFYINPYSGVVKFNSGIDPTDRHLTVAGVAIDQYKDGQLIGTTMNMVPYFPQSFTNSNRRPLIDFVSTQALAEKTSFDFDLDLDPKYNNIDIPNTSLTYTLATDKTHKRVSYPNIYNNGEVLLHGMDLGEGGTVSFTIQYSDPDNDQVKIKIIPVIPDLFNRYPWTLNDDENGSAEFSWQVPSDISEFSSLDSYSFMFMVYAEDNGGALEKLNGQNIEPISITVHKKPGVEITSETVESGAETNDTSIDIKIALSNIDLKDSDSVSFTLLESDFIIQNATISNLTASDNGRYYTATLTPNPNPLEAPVATSIKLPADKFQITKTGGHRMNSVTVPNTESNLFEWTSNQIKPTVEFEFFDSQGNLLANDTANNSPYIVGKITPSEPAIGFQSSDLDITGSTNASITSFKKVNGVNGEYYTVTISAADNTEGSLDFEIDAGVFENSLGNLNLEGNLASVTPTVTLFEWNFDRIKPQVTISNPFEGNTTTDQNGLVTFTLSEEIRFENNTLAQVLADDELQQNLIGKINAASTNAYFTNFSYNPSSPNQFSLTVNHSGGNRTANLVCPEGIFTDLLGNRSSEVTSSHSYNLNLPRLSNIYTVTKNSRSPYNYIKGGELDYLTSTSPVEILLAFSGQSKNIAVYPNNDNGYEGTWDGRNFSINEDDFTLSSGTISNIQFFGLTDSTDELGNKEQLFKALYTPDGSDGFVEITHNAGSFQNVSGIPNIESRKQFSIDTTAPVLTIVGFTKDGIPVNQGSVTNEDDLIFKLLPNEPITGLDEDEIEFWSLPSSRGVRALKKGLQDFEQTDQSLSSTFSVNHFNGDGQYKITVGKKRFTDLANNFNTDAFTFNWYYDTTSPSVAIQVLNGNSSIGDNEYVANNTVEVKYVFNETGMHSGPTDEASLIQLLNDNASNISITTASFDSTNQIITATGVISNTIISPAEITIDFPQNIFSDRGGNLNTEANQRSFIFDNNVPEPTISLTTSDTVLAEGDLFTSNTLNVTFEFSADLDLNSSFSLGELESILSSQLPNGTLSNLERDGNSFTALISSYDDGDISVKFPKDLVFTPSGVKNIEAISTVIYDGTPPNAFISVSKVDGELLDDGSKTNQENLNVTIITSEISNDLAYEDLSLTGSVNSTTTFNKVDDYTYSLTLTNTASGLVTLTLATNSYSDPAGNQNNAITQFSYDFDAVRPVPTITSSGVSGTTALSNSVPIVLTFSEPVEFSLGNENLENYISSLVANGRVSDFSKEDNTTITFNVNRVANGTVTITLPENVFYDTHENGNTSEIYSFIFDSIIDIDVAMTSDNSLEGDYTLTYLWSGNNTTKSRTVPGTRTLLSQGEIDNLYVNSTHSLTFNLTASAQISTPKVKIEGVEYNAITNDGGNGVDWTFTYPMSNSSNEGIVEFEIIFTDTQGKQQPSVSTTSDTIYYILDNTPPNLDIELYSGGKKVDLANESLASVQHNFVIKADEPIFEQIAFKKVLQFFEVNTSYYFNGSLSWLAAKIQLAHDKDQLQNYHNSGLFDRISSTIPMYESSGPNRFNDYFNPDRNRFPSRVYFLENNHLQLFPLNGSDTYSIEVPDNYFMDLAGNMSIGKQISNIKLFETQNSGSSEVILSKRVCDFSINANYTRVAQWYSYQYEFLEFIVELSDTEDFSTVKILSPNKYRIINRVDTNNNEGGDLRIKSAKSVIDFELDLEQTTYVRFRTIERHLNFIGANDLNTKQFEHVSNVQHIIISDNPVEILGANQICGINQTSDFDITEITGGNWSVSDNSIATIDENTGALTTLKAGNVDIKYTTSDGCEFIKSLEIFDDTKVQITANGQVEFCEGYSVSLSSNVSKNFVWYKDGTPLTNLTSSSVNLESITDSGTYTLKFTTPCGEITSNSIVVKVNSKPNSSKINSVEIN